MSKYAVARPDQIGGHSISSTRGGGLVDEVFAVPPNDLPGGLRLTATDGFLCLRLDLRFPAIWFPKIVIAGKRLHEFSGLIKR